MLNKVNIIKRINKVAIIMEVISVIFLLLLHFLNIKEKLDLNLSINLVLCSLISYWVALFPISLKNEAYIYIRMLGIKGILLIISFSFSVSSIIFCFF